MLIRLALVALIILSVGLAGYIWQEKKKHKRAIEKCYSGGAELHIDHPFADMRKTK
jgi:hypothetical protein